MSNRRINSFDVFDTVLTRAVGSPVSVFLLMGVALRAQRLITCTPEEFAKARVEAETQVCHSSTGGQAGASEIYRRLAQNLGLEGGISEQLLETELRLQGQLLRPVPNADRWLDGARRDGPVVFTSDMYLPSSFIEAQLKVHGLWREQDRLYVSCDCGKSKASGALFEHVANAEGTTVGHITHRGNDPLTDIKAARRAGVLIGPITVANLTSHERLLEQHSATTDGLASMLAGAARMARLSIAADSQHDMAIRDAAADVAGPTLCAYVIWLLRAAEQKGLRRLYFVSRDGQILLPVAQRIADQIRLKIDLRYLYGSRQSWHLAAMEEGDAGSWLTERSLFLSVRNMVARLGIAPEAIEPPLSLEGLGPTQWDRDLCQEEIERVLAVLRSPAVATIIREVRDERRAIAIDYLRQEGLLDGTPWGYVDVGWRGRMQASLARLLKTAGGPKPVGFYFGLAERPADSDAGDFHAYMFDVTKSAGMLDVLNGPHSLLEVFCAGTHGLVLNYNQVNGITKPVFKSESDDAAVEWGTPLVHRAVFSFAERVLLDPSVIDLDADLRPAIASLLHRFWFRPTRDEARAWGQFPKEDDQTGAFRVPLARPLTLRDAFEPILPGRFHTTRHSLWQPASVAAASFILRNLLRAGRSIGRLRNKTSARLRQAMGLSASGRSA